MATGLWTLASLLVVTGASGADHWATNQRNLSVPIKFVERRTEIRQLILYVSTDHGKSWSESAVAGPEKESFPFFALTDGMYWMKLCIVSKDGSRSPKDISKGDPALKILVDTLKPAVRITSAERQGDGIVVRWEIQEDHPEVASLRMEYRSADDTTRQWYAVPVEPSLTGSTRFRFAGAGGASIRLQLRDTAGNTGQDTFELSGVNGPALTQGSEVFAPNAPERRAAAPGMLPNVSPNPNSPIAPPPPAPPSVSWANPNDHAAPSAPLVNEPARPSFTTTAPQGAPIQMIPTVSGPRVIATSDNSHVVPVSMTQPSNTIHRPRPMLPNRQIVGNPTVSVQFDVRKPGPSGIGRVELWMTQDEGQSWRQLPAPPAEESCLKVELPGEGIYGLRLVVLSRAGRGKRPPQPGDLPEMMVEVDQTQPRCVLHAPEPDSRRPNTLLLSWNVSDANLTMAPITLEWSETGGTGHWNPIVTNHPNNSRYSWEVPGNIPSSVFLRLTARDSAGNVGYAPTPDPVLVDLSEPEGRLIGIIAAPITGR